jgi:HSP20 family protein
MGIMDKVGALLPWRGERQARPPGRAGVLSLRDDFDRWLQRLVEAPQGFPTMSELGWTPSADVHETDDELVVTVEVPGLDRDDLDLMITPDGLTIRGEKREEKEHKRKDYHLVECRYGGFVRTVPLPPGLDLDRAEARVKRGVLTVRLPKVAERAGTHHVPMMT